NVSALVETSEVGVDHWGQAFHRLRVRLNDNRIVPVDTFLVKHRLKIGRQIEISRHQGFWGNFFYRVEPNRLSPTEQNR
nr:hypothetical protein [Alphaproteobacteria bacterium]